jgi:hypothetical protein
MGPKVAPATAAAVSSLRTDANGMVIDNDTYDL